MVLNASGSRSLSYMLYTHYTHFLQVYDFPFYFFNFIFQWALICMNVVQLLPCLTLCDPMDCSTPGFPVLHHLLEFAQTHVHWVSDANQPSCPLLSPSPPAVNLSHHQDLFQWVSSSHWVAKVLELHLQHQSFQRIFMVDFLKID